MGKYVITTTQVIVRNYYVQCDHVEFALDSIAMGELSEFSSQFQSEDVVLVNKVKDFPVANHEENVNAATYKFNKQTDKFDIKVRWDLDETV